ncbi:hypothetical protein FGO68_gene1155 [Halteria grandinella]|uniref:EF-hand domain-containing protein n=1 Tax=Halteria grandinella TaxID=5974 RepID=A0A8J8SWY4_HALGN|nr:hypothetical protein FGO68_gene1155 [Halteria grandinella]
MAKNVTSLTSANIRELNQSQISQVDMQFKANQTKAKLKQLFKNIDDGKSGYIKDDLFFQLLQLHGINLSPEAKSVITSSFKKGDKVKYSDAMPVICIDFETSEAQQEHKWTIRKDAESKKNDTHSMRSTYSRAKSQGNAGAKLINFDQLSRIAEINHQLETDKAAKPVEQKQQEPAQVSAAQKAIPTQQRKSLIEYPSYLNQDEKQYSSYVEGASPKRLHTGSEQKENGKVRLAMSYKTKELPSYLKTLLVDKQENTQELIQTITALFMKQVDPRQLALLKIAFVKNDKEGLGKMNFSQFKKVFQTIMKQTHSDSQEVFEILCGYVLNGLTDHSDLESSTVNYERLNLLIEAFQFYPLIVKRDKNISNSIHQVLNSQKPDPSQTDEIHIRDRGLDHLHSLLELIWIKIQERYLAVAQAFRFFDVQNSGKISKSDFIFGLEQLKVKLSSNDLQLVFDYLDKNRDGFVSYSEFCYLCEEKRRNIDPFDSSNSAAVNKSVTHGALSLGQEDEMDKLERMSMASNFYQGFKSKKMKAAKQNTHTFGVTSLPSDSISKIMTHQFEKDFNEKIQTKYDKERELFQALFNKRQARGGHTKASKIRHEYQQQQRRIGSSSIEYAGSAITLRPNSLAAMGDRSKIQILPPLKNNSIVDDQIRKLISTAQSAQKPQSSQVKLAPNLNQSLLRENLPSTEMKETEGVNKDEILSQYFSTKRNLKGRL